MYFYFGISDLAQLEYVSDFHEAPIRILVFF
jgi:hypothetical protein